MNLKALITLHFNQLSPELQRAAEYALQNSSQLVVVSMRTFALSAGFKPATFMRLAQRLGYQGWGELKQALIEELGLHDDTYVAKARKLVDQGKTSSLYSEMITAHESNLLRTHDENQRQMQHAVDLLEAAAHTYICGYRASFPVAWSLFYVYRLFNRKVTLIDGLASDSEIYSREFTAEDCLLIASFAPYSRESLQMLQAAQSAGSKIIALTDSPLSPLAQAADCVLLFSTDSPSFFPSIVAGLSISECLMAMLVARHGTEAVTKIENAERYLKASGAYVPPGKS
ncbi:MurR/RpiR family transcriptional regulator [Pantoea sp. A4]|uniref:MurR/RpiR family transcriptional regulator n=1 Tax=Pantoea sp. A4 TaxID=1225184 RepID=UPI0003810EA8|nr:MurR/RpiR family transcriptional regulator [Pantoea sp. A4]